MVCKAIFCALLWMEADYWSKAWRVLYYGTEWRIGWVRMGMMLHGSNRSDRDKKSLFQVKLIISNIFFLAGTQGFENFFEESYFFLQSHGYLPCSQVPPHTI